MADRPSHDERDTGPIGDRESPRTGARAAGSGTPDREPAAPVEPVGTPRERAAEARERQRDEFGGFQLASAFFGWLVAVGLGVLLTALLSAAGAAIGLTTPAPGSQGVANAQQIGLTGAIALLVVLFIAYFAGGYVAGRMTRFNGAKQGLGVWVIALVVTAVLALVGAVAGAEYNVLAQLNLPSIPVGGNTLAAGGAIALVVTLLVTLIAAVLGGQLGVRYHVRVDRAGYLA